MTQDSSEKPALSAAKPGAAATGKLDAAGKPIPSLLEGVTIRKALPTDADAIHALLRPYVAQRLLLARTEAEVIELTRHGFMAVRSENGVEKCLGFAAVEIYSAKLAELLSLAVHHECRNIGVGRMLVDHCVQRARELGVMEVMAISSSEEFFQNCGFDYSLPDQKKAFFCQLRPRHPHSD
ncbi:Amino-acid acetyltransferase [Novipirellula galeiformis]|uniref:Amino-acid acetyltransferase n=1 Tax=Novipirellula galeiformis TaxID=2528004 RepID=A0A5C6CFR9_9BACT|nr:GNAT family N-acetyltransferase [Novipirellula galeiformis]TWU23002.1 Amino-acid acetyltransferase [Novipirellula galeiformis]